MIQYTELQVTTPFSFLRGASHAEELVAQARHLGLAGIGVTDRNSLAGAVRMHAAARDAGLRCVIGARLALVASTDLPPPPTPPHMGEGGGPSSPPPLWGRDRVGGVAERRM